MLHYYAPIAVSQEIRGTVWCVNYAFISLIASGLVLRYHLVGLLRFVSPERLWSGEPLCGEICPNVPTGRPEEAINHRLFSTVSKLLSSWGQVTLHILLILTHLLILVRKYLKFARPEQPGLAILHLLKWPLCY